MDTVSELKLQQVCKMYFEGYDEGYQSMVINIQNVPDEFVASKAMGWCDGLWATRNNQPEFQKPKWMTEEQFGSALKLYLRGQSILPTFPEFVSKIEDYGGYCGVVWAGMFVGIEKDGYAHT